MSNIDAKYLTKVYKDGEYALKNCSLRVKSGEFLVIVGVSGAGKSTLLKVLAGTEPLSSGELYFDGILADNIPMSKRNVSMAFQEYVLYPHMTVFDNLATPLKLAKEDEKSIYDKVMDTLRLFGLEHTADVKPKHLSGGEQQRVAVARAIVNNPMMLIADEPTGNLDPDTAWEIMSLLNDINRRGTTVVVATHAKEIVDKMQKRVIAIEQGVIHSDIKRGVYTK